MKIGGTTCVELIGDEWIIWARPGFGSRLHCRLTIEISEWLG
jgi:hypothetical protein